MSSNEFNPYSPPEAEIGGAIEATPGGPAWLTIFVRPRATIRRILDSGKTAAVLPLVVNFGLYLALPEALRQYRAGKVDIDGFLLKFLGQGIGGAVVGLFVLGFAIRLTGRWIGGKANQNEIRTAMAWSTIPFVPMFLLERVANEFFQINVDMKPQTRSQAYAFLALLFLEIAAGIWGIFLWGKCVAEAHRFSWLKAIGSFFLLYLVWVLILLVVLGVGYLLGFRF